MVGKFGIRVGIGAIAFLSFATLVSAGGIFAEHSDERRFDGTYVNARGASLRVSTETAGWARNLMPGTNGGQRIEGGGAMDLAGGPGDDLYILWDSSNRITEMPGGGNDTILSHADGRTVLPPNVENLILVGDQAWVAQGNDADNVIVANDRDSIIDGGRGDDVFVAGKGAAVFNITRGQGSKVIYGFKPGVDHLRLNGYGLREFEQLSGAISASGPDTHIRLPGGDAVILRGLAPAMLKGNSVFLELDTTVLRPTFEDPFNKLALRGSGGIWRTSYGFGGYADRGLPGEQQVYVDPDYSGSGTTALRLQPFSVRNGILSITASPTPPQMRSLLGGQPYVSGLLSSTGAFSQQYGYFEIRARLPVGQGYLPQFWLMPVSGKSLPEIDVMESIGRQPGVIHMTVHAGTTEQPTRVEALAWVDPEQMHTFGVDWRRDGLTWYIDRVAIWHTASTPDMAQEYYTIMNLAMGNEWAGQVDASTGTASFGIDYFKAFSNPDTVSWTIKGRRTNAAK